MFYKKVPKGNCNYPDDIINIIFFNFATFRTEDLLQKYLASQSKLSTMVQKPKQKMLKIKKDLKTNMKSLEIIKKTESFNKESGSEYFPSTDSGKKKKKISNIYYIYFILIF